MKLKILQIFIIFLLILLGINFLVIWTTKNQIVSVNYNLTDTDCIVVLGAGIRGTEPSPMLRDRLDVAIKLYQINSNKILVSGDHQSDDYNEVIVMKNYLLNNGIPSKDIFVDHYGISTYDSIYRLKPIFSANKIVLVSQEYHLYRSLFIANRLGYKAYGIAPANIRYSGQLKRDFREFFARIKDAIKSLINPTSKYLGEAYHIGGDGNKTSERKAG